MKVMGRRPTGANMEILRSARSIVIAVLLGIALRYVLLNAWWSPEYVVLFDGLHVHGWPEASAGDANLRPKAHIS